MVQKTFGKIGVIALALAAAWGASCGSTPSGPANVPTQDSVLVDLQVGLPEDFDSMYVLWHGEHITAYPDQPRPCRVIGRLPVARDTLAWRLFLHGVRLDSTAATGPWVLSGRVVVNVLPEWRHMWLDPQVVGEDAGRALLMLHWTTVTHQCGDTAGLARDN